MPVVGYQTTPTTNSDFGTFAGQQAASAFAMPATGGLISDLHVYCKTDNGSSNSGFLCLWNGSGTLLASVAVTIPASEAFVTGTLGTPVFVTGGSTIFIGAQINSASTVGLFAHYDPNGSLPVDFAHNATIPGNLTNITQHTNSSMGAWADYTVGAWVNTGTPLSPNWVNGEAVVNAGTAGSPNWVDGALGVQVWSGSAWVTGT